MAANTSNDDGNASAPTGATDAVLKSSDPVPHDVVPVRGLDFDAFAGRNVTVAELVENLANVGFQATAIGQAVDIVNGMVGHHMIFVLLSLNAIGCVDRPSSGLGAMKRPARRRPYSSATPPT